jgi:hypothetical protein
MQRQEAESCVCAWVEVGTFTDTQLSRHELVTSRLRTWVKWSSGSKMTKSSAVGFTERMKCLNQCSKTLLWIKSGGWPAQIDPRDVQFVSSVFIFVLGTTSSVGTPLPVGLLRVSTVIRSPRSAACRVDIWRYPLSARTSECLCWTTVIHVSSYFSSLAGEWSNSSIAGSEKLTASGVKHVTRA